MCHPARFTRNCQRLFVNEIKINTLPNSIRIGTQPVMICFACSHSHSHSLFFSLLLRRWTKEKWKEKPFSMIVMFIMCNSVFFSRTAWTVSERERECVCSKLMVYLYQFRIKFFFWYNQSASQPTNKQTNK